MEQTKIALLRGINVGGKRKIKMADLKSGLETLRFTLIKTYIQSGNILFRGSKEKTNTQLALQIQQLILKQFTFEVPVVVFDSLLLKEVINENPYSNETDFINRLYVCFLENMLDSKLAANFNDLEFGEDRFKIHSNYIFILYNTKQSQSKLTNTLIEKKLKITATTRNWKTVLKLNEIGLSFT